MNNFDEDKQRQIEDLLNEIEMQQNKQLEISKLQESEIDDLEKLVDLKEKEKEELSKKNEKDVEKLTADFKEKLVEKVEDAKIKEKLTFETKQQDEKIKELKKMLENQQTQYLELSKSKEEQINLLKKEFNNQIEQEIKTWKENEKAYYEKIRNEEKIEELQNKLREEQTRQIEIVKYKEQELLNKQKEMEAKLLADIELAKAKQTMEFETKKSQDEINKLKMKYIKWGLNT